MIESKSFFVVIKHGKDAVSKLFKDIRNKLPKKVEYFTNESQDLEQGLSDIEDQIIKNSDKIFVTFSKQNHENIKNHPDEEFKTKLIKRSPN